MRSANQNHTLTAEYIRSRVCVTQHGSGMRTEFQDGDGRVMSTVYPLLSGVSLVDKQVQRRDFISPWRLHGVPIFAVEHCREGQLEICFDDETLILKPGDICLSGPDSQPKRLTFPMGRYHADAIYIELEQPDPKLQSCLREAGTEILPLMKRFGLDRKRFCVLRGEEKLGNLFEEIYNAPVDVQLSYWRIKVYELLLLLAAYQVPEAGDRTRHISETQQIVARAVHDYLLEHLTERISTAELAKRFSISPTQLKEGFRAVYGKPIQSFAKEQRIYATALLMRSPGTKVRDIAAQFGYTNMSKFAAAFQSVMGKTPTQYREMMGKETI